MRWKTYDATSAWDELISASGRPRRYAGPVAKYFADLDQSDLKRIKNSADAAIRSMGITFTLLATDGAIDRAWPFDVIPRVIHKREWDRVARGLRQRVQALNLFIHDIYSRQRILKDGVVPRELIVNSENYLANCVGVTPPGRIWAHVCGSDLVRDDSGELLVLEDNLRVPSGVSYMLENRLVMKRVLPELFQGCNVRPIDDYPLRLHGCLADAAPRRLARPEVVVLTPGIHNSAYFEHAYLAQQMGAELVEGSDLLVEDDIVYMKTVEGLKRVDVIYRRIDDRFLDPRELNPDSRLGVPGLIQAWRKRRVTLANAPGAGVADDKAVYAYVPDIIRYYLAEEPLLANVPTYICSDPTQRQHVLANLDKLVIKPANASGGYGLVIGPKASRKALADCAALIKRQPRNYIAQPLLTLSTCPTLAGDSIEPRHLDLRPFVLSGKSSHVTTGGLTRVALQRGSTVVNSSQGGGSKDTWILDLGNR